MQVCKPTTPKLSEFKGTTSNFTRHIQHVHKAKWDEYLQGKAVLAGSSQHSIQSFLDFKPAVAGGSGGSSDVPCSSNLTKYRHTNARQKQISDALSRFIIGCSMPLSLVEDSHFRRLIQVLEPRYQPMARSTLVSSLSQLKAKGREQLLELLAEQSSVSLTADIWSDRTMRSFLGVTAHILGTNPKTGNYGLISLLLTCQRFEGRHTGESIARAFDNIIEDFNIGPKVDWIVTDNASNMCKAFAVKFPVEDNNAAVGDEEDEEVEDETVWEQLDEEDAVHVENALSTNSRKRISCFAHTLQLVVGDGLKEMRVVGRAIAKVTKISTLLHRSTVFKERFEEKFGAGRTIPAAVATRWNSTYHQLKALIKIGGMDCKNLAEVCNTQEFSHVLLTRQEWGQLTELCKVLEPFAEATNLTQGDMSVTISQVVPVVLDLNSHLRKWREDSRYCKPLVAALHTSLRKRFRGIFLNCQMDGDPGAGTHQEPFVEHMYLISAVLDPQFMLHWVDVDVFTDNNLANTRANVKDMLREIVIAEAERVSSEEERTEQILGIESSSSEDEDIPSKVPRLSAKYNSIRRRFKSGEKESARAQLANYLSLTADDGQDAITFWRGDGIARMKYPSLYAIAQKILAIPASSAPVERVFSRGGLIMRPHRARLSSQMLETLMFLKCNEHII